MPQNRASEHTVGDSVLAGGLIASPAWAPTLSSVNELLTTLTLVLGVVLALVRLWLLIKRRRAGREERGE